MRKSSRVTRAEFQETVSKVVDDCELIAQNYIKNWEPMNKEWDTIEGAAYLRLSTDDQVAVEKGSLEQQVYIAISEAEIRSKAQKTNYRINKFFIEPGITGKHDKRPQFLGLRREISRGKIEFVIFKEIARIARETSIWKQFFKLCQEKEVEICIRGFPFNPNDPTQTFQLDIMAAFAEYESNQTSKRIKENNFSAIMTSGKFNSTHSILGFNQLVVNGVPKVGLYTINHNEIKTVEWIMQRFCTFKSQNVVLEELLQKGILNKEDKKFTTGTLKRLLVNKRYIGKWEVNKKNKAKKQEKLMAYDQYQEIDLPHGEAIDSGLWDRVQKTIAEVAGNKTKDKCSTRIYPLTPILYYEDGSKFQGSAGWSQTRKKHFYYYNKKHKLRIPVAELENKTIWALNNVIENSNELQNALKRRLEMENSTADFYKIRASELEDKRICLEEEKRKLNRRLDFLLDDSNEETLKSFKLEYKKSLEEINKKENKLLGEISSVKDQNEQIPELRPEPSEMLKNSITAEKFASEGKLQELRGILRSLFSRIIIGKSEADGSRKILFVLKNKTSSASFDMEDVFVGHWVQMVEHARLELATTRL